MVYKKNIKSRVKGSFERGREQGRENLRIKEIIKKEVAEDEFERGYYRPNKAVKKIAELSVSAEDKLRKTGTFLQKTGKFAKKVGTKLKPVGKVLYDVAETITRPPTQSKSRRAQPQMIDKGYARKSFMYGDDNDFEDMGMGWHESEEYRPFGKPFGEKNASRLKSSRGVPISYNPVSTIMGMGMQVEGGSRHLIGDIPRQSYGMSGSTPQTVSAILDIGKPKGKPAPRNVAFIEPKLMDIPVSRSRPVASIESIMNIGLNSAVKSKSTSSITKSKKRK